MQGWQFWWGIAAFFLGGLATQLNGWLTYRRQRADKAADAMDALRQRREEFELQHLVEVNRLVRVALDRLLEYYAAERRYRTAREAGRPTVELLPQTDEASGAFTVALSDLTSQTSFILDSSVRDAAGNLVGHMAHASALLMGSGELDLVQLSAVADRLHQPLGERVRAIYAGQSAAF